eukprot:scaffold23020_cov79-Phaeocystis_antarctica.AAC.2
MRLDRGVQRRAPHAIRGLWRVWRVQCDTALGRRITCDDHCRCQRRGAHHRLAHRSRRHTDSGAARDAQIHQHALGCRQQRAVDGSTGAVLLVPLQVDVVPE